MSDAEPRRPGRRIVVTIYLAVLALTGLFGFVIGWIVPVRIEPTLLGIVELPPTPLSVALYGVVTVGLILGVLLVLVDYVSRKTGFAER